MVEATTREGAAVRVEAGSEATAGAASAIVGEEVVREEVGVAWQGSEPWRARRQASAHGEYR